MYARAPMELTDPEIRVLGCLLEKQRVTPESYPLTLNGLRTACNQATNRDPVVDYDEEIVREAAARLVRRRWARSVAGHSGRVSKFRHLIDTELSLGADQLAILAVLLLRGPQTPGELSQRTRRLHEFAGVEAVLELLGAMIATDLVERLPRRPGQKEERFRHRYGIDQDDADGHPASGSIPAVAAPHRDFAGDNEFRSLSDRVERIEAELAELRVLLDDLTR